MKRATWVALVATAMAAGAGAASAVCLQDQFGNQWDFTVDQEHQYLYGSLILAQPCQDPVWPVLGSFTRPPLVIELTAANPTPQDLSCSTSKLKGPYPAFAWFYEDGYGGQEDVWVPCGTPVVERDAPTGGLVRPAE